MAAIRDKKKQSEIQNKADLIWSIADKLTGAYKPHEYGLVILPFVVLRRFDCALAGKRSKILAKYKELEGMPEELIEPLLEEEAGLKYYDLNPKGLRSVLENPKDVAGALGRFIDNFSKNVRSLLEEFKIYDQIQRLEESSNGEGGLLFAVIDEITQEKNDLSPDKISDIDMGYIFEEIIRRFSESYNEDAGQHYTPRDAIDLMVNILIRDEDKSITKETARTLLDPACGTGGMLSEAREYMREINPKIHLQCHGQEINPETYAICCANSLIKDSGYNNISEIKKGNTLSNYQFKGKKFNYIISNPPFGREWKVDEKAVRAEAADLEHGRFVYGLPGITDSQMLFLSEAISAMESPYEGQRIGGRVAIIHNGSPLFTGDAGSGPSEIRRYLLENDLLDAIIALPKNIFYNTDIATYIWVLDNNKKEERRGKVQLIDASSMFTLRKKNVGKKRVDIDEIALDIISKAYHQFDNAVYKDDNRSCESKILCNYEFGYVKAAIIVPKFDNNGNVVKNKRGSVVYDKDKSDTESISFGKVDLLANKDYLKDSAIIEAIDSHMESEVLPFVPGAEIDYKKTKIGFEIPFSRYFYRPQSHRSSLDIKNEIKDLTEQLNSLLMKITE